MVPSMGPSPSRAGAGRLAPGPFSFAVLVIYVLSIGSQLLVPPTLIRTPTRIATATLLLTAGLFSQTKTQSIAIEGMDFAYVDLGSGPPVILIHGSMADCRVWSPQMEALAKHHRVIAYSPNSQGRPRPSLSRVSLGRTR